MDQVYNFDKSFQQRLREYMDVLSGFEVLPASALSKEWGFYIELTIDPNGWQAVWKLSRPTCDALEISFPTIVLVFVLSIDFPTLQAHVRVIAVQDDIHIPEKHYVPLVQLWPTKGQDRSVALNLSSTANVVDMLRFFYIHLFMPWDLEDEDTTDWRSKHLESRLRLFYDMKNGVIPKGTSERLNSLLTEARRLQSKKNLIELELEDSEIDDDLSQKHVDSLSDIHLSLLEIKSEVEILENPFLRKALIRRQQKNSMSNDSKESKIWVIHDSSPIVNYIRFLEEVKLFYPNENVIIQHNLPLTLENGSPKDIFILSEGKYEMNVVGALESGGTLKGIGTHGNTILISTLENIMFDFQVGQSLIENIIIDASSSQCAVVIRKGKVTFSNCKIFGDGLSTTHQGIIVLAGSELELINCEIFGFYTAVVGNSDSKITLKSTEVHSVHFGLKIYDKSCINAQKCIFRDCKDYAICLETENNLEGDNHRVGDFDVLNIIPEVTTEFLSGMNNAKGDVVINHTSQINAMEDLFSNHDPTISEAPSEEDMVTDDEDREMNEFENTVVENMRNVSPATV